MAELHALGIDKSRALALALTLGLHGAGGWRWLAPGLALALVLLVALGWLAGVGTGAEGGKAGGRWRWCSRLVELNRDGKTRERVEHTCSIGIAYNDGAG